MQCIRPHGALPGSHRALCASHNICQYPGRAAAVAARRACCHIRASASDSTDESAEQSSVDEARLEALERGVKRKQGAKAVAAQTERMQRREVASSKDLGDGGMAEWREGALFPEGWDSMPLPQKVAELYTGKRGLLFWMGKVTYALIFVLIGGWIVFRFVLPGLGVLELQNGLDSPPNY